MKPNELQALMALGAIVVLILVAAGGVAVIYRTMAHRFHAAEVRKWYGATTTTRCLTVPTRGLRFLLIGLLLGFGAMTVAMAVHMHTKVTPALYGDEMLGTVRSVKRIRRGKGHAHRARFRLENGQKAWLTQRDPLEVGTQVPVFWSAKQPKRVNSAEFWQTWMDPIMILPLMSFAMFVCGWGVKEYEQARRILERGERVPVTIEHQVAWHVKGNQSVRSFFRLPTGAVGYADLKGGDVFRNFEPESVEGKLLDLYELNGVFACQVDPALLRTPSRV